MGIEYYAFALFVAGLISLIAILCKVLFADLRRQHKLLDEKETKLLQLYRTVENIMEEFADQIKTTTEEMKEHESRLAQQAAAIALPPEPAKKEPAEKLPRSVTVDSTRIRAASEVLERAERIIKSDALKNHAAGSGYGSSSGSNRGNSSSGSSSSGNNSGNSSSSGGGGGAVFQRFFDETASEQPAHEAEKNGSQTRTEAILALASEGKTEAQIASEMGITRYEVRLVVGLKK